MFDRLEAVFPEFINVHILSDESVLDGWPFHLSVIVIADCLPSANVRGSFYINTQLPTLEEIWSPEIKYAACKVKIDGIKYTATGGSIPKLAHGKT